MLMLVLVFVLVVLVLGRSWVLVHMTINKIPLRAPSAGGILADQGGVPQPASAVWEHRRERPMALMSP